METGRSEKRTKHDGDSRDTDAATQRASRHVRAAGAACGASVESRDVSLHDGKRAKFKSAAVPQIRPDCFLNDIKIVTKDEYEK